MYQEKERYMIAETIISSTNIWKFLLAEVDEISYDVKIITATADEIKNDELKDYGIYNDEQYSVLKTCGNTREVSIINMEVGDIVELDSGVTLTRLV